jgi:capsular polysaccharide transport system ATP-binding protein
MRVELQGVTKIVAVRGKPRALFDRLDLAIEEGSHIGILALPKSGKSTLLRLICGTERCDGGTIRRDMNISWPIPQSDFLAPHSSISWNIRSIARLYGVKDPDFVRRVGELGSITRYLNMTLPVCPPYVRPQLGFALGIGMDFDLYLFDNVCVPQRKEFKPVGVERLRQRTEGRAIVVATSLPPQISEICDSAYVLENGRLAHFPGVAECVAYFKEMQQAEAERQKELQGRSNPEDDDQEPGADEDARSVDMAVAGLSDII